MNLNSYRDEVGDFLRKADPQGYSSNSEIVKMLNDEFEQLKNNLNDHELFCHQIYDLMFLLFELAAVNNCNLDAEWESGREKKKKYLKPI